MVVNYNLSVSTSRPGTFLRLLFRWRGSVWKATWIQLCIFLIIYALVSVVYRWLLNEWQQQVFAAVADYTNRRLRYFPMDLILGFFVTAIIARWKYLYNIIGWMDKAFVHTAEYVDSRLSYFPMDLILGFFVTAVLARWTYLYNIIGWMDNIGLMTAQYVRGTSDHAVQLRRNIIRYCQLTQVLVFRDLSMKARKRFPTLDTLVAAGFMMEHEKERFDEIQYGYSKYFLPFNWAWALTYRARKEGLIEGDYYQTVVSEEIRKFRTDLAWLCNYDWVPLPLLYPTLVCTVVHIYFLVCVVARQFVDESKYHKGEVDMYFPFMTVIQFILYMGWLKVAEALLNPWGEDDDDFETNMLIDRNLAMGLMMVDEGYGKTPELKKDMFWDDEWVPLYSEESAREAHHDYHEEGSMSTVKLPSSVSMVRMVPLHRESSDAAISRVASKTRLVEVKPEEHKAPAYRRGNSIASISMIKGMISSRSKLHLNLSGHETAKQTLKPVNSSASQPDGIDGSHDDIAFGIGDRDADIALRSLVISPGEEANPFSQPPSRKTSQIEPAVTLPPVTYEEEKEQEQEKKQEKEKAEKADKTE